MKENWDLVKAYKDELDRYKFLNRIQLSKISILEQAVEYYKDRTKKAETELLDTKMAGYPNLATLKLSDGEYKTYNIKRKE